MQIIKPKYVTLASVALYFLAFTLSNIQSINKYLDTEARWAPKLSEGPLLYQVSETNPSRFSRDRDKLFFLYFLTKKNVHTNLEDGDDRLAFYYRINCKLGERGNVVFQGYDYACPDLTLRSPVDDEALKSCQSFADGLVFENIRVCSGSIREFDSVYLYRTEGQYLILPVRNGYGE